MLRKNILITLIFSISLMGWSQVCPKGFTWNAEKATCIAANDNTQSYAIVNYKCPNGYSWVTFKNDCLTNKRVREIYDSLRILYLKDPEIKDTPEANLSPLAVNVPKNAKVPEISNTPITYNNLPTAESTTEQTRQIQIWIEKGVNNEKKVRELKDQIDSLKQEFAVLRSWTQSQGNSTYRGNEASTVVSIQEQLRLQKIQIEDLKSDIAALKSRPTNHGTSNYTFDVGKQNGIISKQSMYGQENLTFEIHCPSGYKWVIEESICLSSDMFLIRSQVKAQNPNGQVQYGIKDVKCPSNFRWNSESNQCIPTLHAVSEKK